VNCLGDNVGLVRKARIHEISGLDNLRFVTKKAGLIEGLLFFAWKKITL